MGQVGGSWSLLILFVTVLFYSCLFFAKIAKISVCFKIPANVQQQYSNNIIVF